MTKTMDLYATQEWDVGKKQGGPLKEVYLILAVNWDPLMCCILSMVFMPKPFRLRQNFH